MSAFQRFPVACICIMLLFLIVVVRGFGVSWIKDHPIGSFVYGVCFFGLIECGVLSTAFRLRSEAGYSNPVWLRASIYGFFVLLAAWTAWISPDMVRYEMIYLLLSTCLVPGLLMFVLPFFEDRDDSRLLRLARPALARGVLIPALWFFCFVLLSALSSRLGSKSSTSLFFISCNIFVIPVLFLNFFPRIEEAGEAEGGEAKAGKAVNPALGCRLFAGFTALSMLASFAHGIATFYMNRFTVSLFVQLSFFSMVLLLILYLLPDHIKSERMRKLWMKLLTVGQLLLLLLMEIVSWSRPFAFQSGVEISVMLIGLWCIAACLILLLAGQKKFRILLCSLCGFLILTGLYPKMFTKFEQNRREERMAVAQLQGQLPGKFIKSLEDARAFLKKIPEDRDRLCRDLVDLHKTATCEKCVREEYSEDLIDLCDSPAESRL